MSWQDDCATAGGAAVVFPYPVPLNVIFPELPTVSSVVTVPGFPACRTRNDDGTLNYAMPTLTVAERYSIVQETLGDEAMAELVGPLQAVSDAAAAVASPIKAGLVLGVAAVAVLLYLSARRS